MKHSKFPSPQAQFERHEYRFEHKVVDGTTIDATVLSVRKRARQATVKGASGPG